MGKPSVALPKGLARFRSKRFATASASPPLRRRHFSGVSCATVCRRRGFGVSGSSSAGRFRQLERPRCLVLIWAAPSASTRRTALRRHPQCFSPLAAAKGAPLGVFLPLGWAPTCLPQLQALWLAGTCLQSPRNDFEGKACSLDQICAHETAGGKDRTLSMVTIVSPLALGYHTGYTRF